MSKEKTLQDLFHDTLKDIYYAERKILKALPKMKRAAQSEQLKAAFEKLQSSQTKLGEAIYAQAQAGEQSAESGESAGGADEDDVVDAEVIDDEDEKK